jgi:hypothetical protein
MLQNYFCKQPLPDWLLQAEATARGRFAHLQIELKKEK